MDPVGCPRADSTPALAIGSAAFRATLLWAMTVVPLPACDREGAAVEAKPQTIAFPAIAAPAVDQTTCTAMAVASSGLPVRYSSLTATVCSVDGNTGAVTGLTSGTCIVAADQSGNSHYAPAPRATRDVAFNLTREVLSFAQVPSLGLYDRATIVAIDSLAAKVSYASITPQTCSVDVQSGRLDALAPGECTVVASAGPLQASQTLVVAAPSSTTVPDMPTGITVTAGDTADTVIVNVAGTVSGGAPIIGYLVVSKPSGISANPADTPSVIDCPSGCAGFAFSLSARNTVGTGVSSPFVDVVTEYDVLETFYEPDTQPNDTLFVGSFTVDATTGTVSRLRGVLSESMTGGDTPYPRDTMTWLPLDYQLSALAVSLDGADGLLVTTFRLPTTDTLSNSPTLGGGDGWSPGTGRGIYFGYPGENLGNAYARIFVNLSDPAATPTQSQIDALAYADCGPGGMMGATCMTGTSVAGYGKLGTMSGYPAAQVIAKR